MPKKGRLWAGSTKVSSGVSRNLSWDSIQIFNGFASGSVGCTLTLLVMIGSI